MDLMFQPLKKYADFQGRARRKEFWLWILFNCVVGLVFYLMLLPFGGAFRIDPVTMAPGLPTGVGMLILVVQWIYSLAVLIPNLAVSVRRLHDTNRTGWWLLLYLVPLIGFIVLLIFFVMEGTKGSNRFGPDPTGASSADTFN